MVLRMTQERRKDIDEKEVIAEFEERRSKLTRLAIVIGHRWRYQPHSVPKWYIKDHDGNYSCNLIYMGVNCARENLAMPFMQRALGKTIPWFKITEILPSVWNKSDRGMMLNASPDKTPIGILGHKLRWRFSSCGLGISPSVVEISEGIGIACSPTTLSRMLCIFQHPDCLTSYWHGGGS